MAAFRIPLPDASLELGAGRTAIMGVINVTPDSFHVSSRTPSWEAAIAAGERQVAEGAAILDVGGESTRPGSKPLPADEEIARVLPVIEGLRARVSCPISVDTYKAEVARQAIAAGASLINDVSGGLLDPALPAVAAELGVGVIVGHMRGRPETMQQSPSFVDVVAEVSSELSERLAIFRAAGLPADRLLVDPGIGFGKRVDENVALLAHLAKFSALGRPIVIGVSRKGFLGALLRRAGLGETSPEERLEASLAAAALAVQGGAAVIRTHDVAATRRCLAIADAIVQSTRGS